MQTYKGPDMSTIQSTKLHYKGMQQRRDAEIETSRHQMMNFIEALLQATELPEYFEPFTEEERKTIHDYKEAFHYHSRVLQYALNTASTTSDQSLDCEWIRDVETTTRNI
eukprot:6097419-Amphidinium_carterae.4